MAIPGRAVNKAAQTIEELVKLIRSGGGFDDAGKMLPKPATLLERSKMQRPSSGILDNAAPINAGEDQLVSSLLDSQRRMNQGVNQHFFPSSRGMASEIPAKSPGMGVTPPTTPNAPIPGIMSRVGGAIGRNKGKTALGSAIAGLAGYGALRGDATPEQPSIGNEELMKKLVEAGITPDVMMAIMQDPSGRAMDIVKAITSKQQGPASSAPSSGMARPQPSRQFTPNPQMPTQLPPQFEQAQLERQDLNNPFAGLTQSPNAMGAPQNLGRTKRRNPLLGAIAGFGKGLGNAFLGR
jgi:hypothetical protein